MAADVNPSQDDGRYQEHSQHDAHNGAQVHRRALGLRGQVVLKSCGDDKEKLGLRALGSGRVPEMNTPNTHTFKPTERYGESWWDVHANTNVLAPLMRFFRIV